MEIAIAAARPLVTQKRLNLFERYLTVWVGLCMLGRGRCRKSQWQHNPDRQRNKLAALLLPSEAALAHRIPPFAVLLIRTCTLLGGKLDPGGCRSITSMLPNCKF